MTNDEILNIKVIDGDGSQTTIKEFLFLLMSTLWRKEEGFSGKRPFGNSGWKHAIYEALVRENVIDGVIDEDGYVESIDQILADCKVQKLIEHIFK